MGDLVKITDSPFLTASVDSVSCEHNNGYLHESLRRIEEGAQRLASTITHVEALRLLCGISKGDLAAELRTTTDALRNWMTGRTVGRKETVAKIKAFLIRKSCVASIGSG